MSTDFRIAETDTFIKKIGKADFRDAYNKIVDYVYPQLRKNPFYGPNIKRLKGDFSGVYRYRIGRYRLFYSVEIDRVILFIINISHRRESYKKT